MATQKQYPLTPADEALRARRAAEAKGAPKEKAYQAASKAFELSGRTRSDIERSLAPLKPLSAKEEKSYRQYVRKHIVAFLTGEHAARNIRSNMRELQLELSARDNASSAFFDQVGQELYPYILDRVLRQKSIPSSKSAGSPTPNIDRLTEGTKISREDVVGHFAQAIFPGQPFVQGGRLAA